MEENYYSLDLEQVYQKLNTNINDGLTEQEAAKRLEEFGSNEIPKVSKGFIKIYLAPLFNWLIVIYLVCSLIMLIASLLGEDGSMTMILLMLVIVAVNCLIAIFQQFRATKKMKALRELSAPTSTLMRDGVKKEVQTKDLVVGDLLILNRGDKIPADARIIESSNLEINEASLTGESEPVRKVNDGRVLRATEEISIGGRINMVFYGTYITTGNGKSIIVKTGGDTEIGKISRGLEEAGTSDIPIREKMNNFGKWLGVIIVILWIIILLFKGILFDDWNVAGSLNAALDLMPINLPLLVSIVLLTGVLAMAKYGVIVRNIASVDSLGRTSVVCSDKTGTLTKNQMSVQYMWSNGSIYKVTGAGYTPEGKIIRIDDPKNPTYVDHIENFPQLKLLLTCGFLNNNSALVKNEVKTSGKVVETWSVIGSVTEGSLMVLFQKGMGDYILDNYDSIIEYPFDSSVKRMTKVFRKEEKYYSFTKGASEILIPLCLKILYKGAHVEFTDELRAEVMSLADNYANKGYRILSLCYKEFYMMPQHSAESRDMFETEMSYLDFVAILDPPREGVKNSVEQCHDAGVEVIMITGDSPATAKSIAEQISIIKSQDDLVCEGKDIKDMINSKKFNYIKVFARVSPEHKEDIIKKYQSQDKVVAMTGDGVNDALALNLADAGLSMGITGTDVAKEASDMVISDDSFNSIVKGIHQGRGIFAKVRAVVFFYVVINVFEGLVAFLLAVVFNYPWWVDPSSEFYMMWMFLSITLHIFPGLILTFDTTSDDVMKETPKDEEEILSKNTLILILIYGVLLALTMLIVYFLVYDGSIFGSIYPVFPENTEFGAWNDAYLYSSETIELSQGVALSTAKALTMLMVTLYFCESFLIYQIRRPNKSLIKSIKEDSNKFMYLLIGLLFALFLLLMYFPGVQITLAIWGFNFMFMYLTGLDWLVCFLISLICIISLEVVKYIAHLKEIVF